MAQFSNQAILSYLGGTTESNIVTGELLDVLSAAKTAVYGTYGTDDKVTYVISLVNTGNTELTGITVSDDLGGYAVGATTVYPLNYLEGSVKYYTNGVLRTAPTVTAGPPAVFGPLTIPAGGSAVLVYEARTNGYTPQAAGSTVNNTATVTGGGLTAPLTAAAAVTAGSTPELSITKSVTPTTVTDNGTLTYTFVIRNLGNTEADASQNIVVSDTFNPILSDIAVTYNGAAMTVGTDYTYNTATGEFATVAGKITVPAATYTQNAATGLWTTTPGTATLTVSGTV